MRVSVAAKGKTHYLLTATAESDFRKAHQWSLSRWGKELTKQYFADLHEAAEMVARNHRSLPKKGYLTGTTGMGVHAVREHYIVYVPIDEKSIVIVALMRQSRNVPAVLRANDFMIRRQLQEIFERLNQGKIPNIPK